MTPQLHCFKISTKFEFSKKIQKFQKKSKLSKKIKIVKKFQNFQKISNFSKKFKILKNFEISKFSKNFKIFEKFQSGISKLSRAPQARGESSEMSGSRRSPSPPQTAGARRFPDQAERRRREASRHKCLGPDDPQALRRS